MARTQKKVKAKHNRTKKGKQHKKTQKKGVGVYTGHEYVKSRSPRSRRGNERNRRRSPLRSIRSRSRSRGNERYRSRSRRSRSRSPLRRGPLDYNVEVRELNNMIKRTYGIYLPNNFNYFYEEKKFIKNPRRADDIFRELQSIFETLTLPVGNQTLLEEVASMIEFQAGTRNYTINLFDGENLTIEHFTRGGENWVNRIKAGSYNVFFSHVETMTGKILKSVCTLKNVTPECKISDTQAYKGIPSLPGSKDIPNHTAFKVIQVGRRGEGDDIFLVALALELRRRKPGFTINIHTNDGYRWRYPPPDYLGGYRR
jgi:hypothetical protein